MQSSAQDFDWFEHAAYWVKIRIRARSAWSRLQKEWGPEQIILQFISATATGSTYEESRRRMQVRWWKGTVQAGKITHLRAIKVASQSLRRHASATRLMLNFALAAFGGTMPVKRSYIIHHKQAYERREGPQVISGSVLSHIQEGLISGARSRLAHRPAMRQMPSCARFHVEAAFSVLHVFNNLSGREHLRDEPTGVGQDMELPRSVEGKWGPVLRVVEQTMHAIGQEKAKVKAHFAVVRGFYFVVIRGFHVDVSVDRPSMESGSAFGERRDPHSVEQSDRRRRATFVEVYARYESCLGRRASAVIVNKIDIDHVPSEDAHHERQRGRILRQNLVYRVDGHVTVVDEE
ncbi:hypothetical protein EV714DRAFT_240242 [Schizophyllum commune]